MPRLPRSEGREYHHHKSCKHGQVSLPGFWLAEGSVKGPADTGQAQLVWTTGHVFQHLSQKVNVRQYGPSPRRLGLAWPLRLKFEDGPWSLVGAQKTDWWRAFTCPSGPDSTPSALRARHTGQQRHWHRVVRQAQVPAACGREQAAAVAKVQRLLTGFGRFRSQ